MSLDAIQERMRVLTARVKRHQGLRGLDERGPVEFMSKFDHNTPKVNNKIRNMLTLRLRRADSSRSEDH